MTGAFKVRGGINLISQLSVQEREREVITASTGKHGQSVAYAARLFRVRGVVVAPEMANPLKAAAMRDLDAEVLIHGADFDAACEYCEKPLPRKLMLGFRLNTTLGKTWQQDNTTRGPTLCPFRLKAISN